MENQKNLNILIADDKREICDSIEENLRIQFLKFENLSDENVVIKKAFTDHAFKHGKLLIEDGFSPDICIFDLVFNGDTGIDLYKFAVNYLSGKSIHLCIYTGTEKSFQKRKDAEIMASSSHGNVVIIPKPQISDVLSWTERVLVKQFGYIRKFQEKDPFDLL